MENKVNLSKKVLLIIALILLVIAGITAYLNQKDISQTAPLTVYKGEKEVARYSMRDLMKMDPQKAAAHLKSGGGKDVKGKFTGVWLSDLMKSAGISGEDCKTVLLIAGDGYTAAAKGEEVEDILIAYQVDGSPLGKYEDGGTGPLRCIFTKDTYGNRSVMNLVKIRCNLR